MPKRYTYEFVRGHILSRGGELISDRYSNNRMKLDVRCNKGHIWTPTFKEVLRGSWCGYCAKNVKNTVSDLNIMLDKMDATFLGDDFVNSYTALDVLCNKCNHIFHPTYGSIRTGCGCPECSYDVKRFSYDFVASIIEKAGGTLISEKYKSTADKVTISCNKCNLIWDKTFSSIRAGSWCPKCSTGKTQRVLEAIISEIYDNCEIESNYRGFDWLKNKKTGGKQEIDIFVPHMKLAIEYDGMQHFKPVKFSRKQGDAEMKFKRTQQLDKRKNRIIKAHPEDVSYFIRFNYKEKITREFVIQKLSDNGIPIP